MANRSATEAVIVALQRLQSEAVEDVSPRAESIIEPMRDNLQNSPTHSVRIEDPRQQRRTQDSLTKARYALTVLRVAQTTDRVTAARLVRGLARDFPYPNELPEIADIHLSAIDSFSQLAAGLRDATNSQQRHLWETAQGAANDWLRAVDARQ